MIAFLCLLSAVNRADAREHIRLAADRKRRVVDPVVHRNGQEILAILQSIPDLRLKREEAAAVPGNFLSVQENDCVMCHGVTAQNHSLVRAD